MPHYTPSIQQQGMLCNQNSSKTPTGHGYIERSVLMEEVKNQNPWNFQLGSQESLKIPIMIRRAFLVISNKFRL